MKPRRITIKDVAHEAGVSIATASESLNGKGRVAAATRQNVIDVANRMGYTANRIAKSLNAGRTGSLVLTVSPMAVRSSTADLQPEWDIEYYFRVLNGASAEAFQRGFLLSMLPSHLSSEAFLSAADGLIVVDPSDDDELLAQVARTGLACATIGRNSGEFSWVDNDFSTGTTTALAHLDAVRSSRTALFLSETSSSYVRDELSAYLDWCSTVSLDPIIIRSPGPRVDEAEPVIRAALASPDRRFDAVLATLDTLAFATERSAHMLGLAVPEDLQVVSLTDSRYLDYGLQKPITALDLHPVRLGQVAVDLLVAALDGETGRRRELVNASLTVRESTLAD
ncbi:MULTISPECIES: LacI family DNA-binding transcriptional regulator [unclassified Mycolicibacterium]|uniref:LacI family DNA-binding transcriptional regulator n=1 Tax=unclassified Mycolicibacterium TaxID=2636767 RepID=UPI0013079D6C|nr:MULTISPECIES: LacI family DNA-binding transcriptional regulator [unclassified Mycolicibacterium]MUL84142.1 LacI family transcriptional regulator [Mycolicibacterium sp. CBMA 329]MUL89792.1 LacI family transcriptional regulator [Mycolicibacterium sp. CBMA 331]MUL99966.1 LacI family transcriptional regulator [Mycolicibacterium sp. CBMA 334]MUM27118.1 LacI family transcriptional regulator [Mycolicibacterium sp. CBMA 295]MUM39307.1 LacI family transcriptional regulator [Mycolicibacterium sp. CBM